MAQDMHTDRLKDLEKERENALEQLKLAKSETEDLSTNMFQAKQDQQVCVATCMQAGNHLFRLATTWPKSLRIFSALLPNLGLRIFWPTSFSPNRISRYVWLNIFPFCDDVVPQIEVQKKCVELSTKSDQEKIFTQQAKKD